MLVLGKEEGKGVPARPDPQGLRGAGGDGPGPCAGDGLGACAGVVAGMRLQPDWDPGRRRGRPVREERGGWPDTAESAAWGEGARPSER